MPAPRTTQSPTHEVFNQPPPFEDFNAFTSDRVLREVVEREGAGWAKGNLAKFGARVGSAEVIGWGRDANENSPKLKTHDRQGHRIDKVEFHPNYHALMEMSFAQGLQGAPWEHLVHDDAPKPGAIVARQAGSYMMVQVESGHCCPITMTNAVVPSLLFEPALAREWIPRIVSRQYDSAFRPAEEKTSATLGMGMTEKQGGTDVRANTTRAVPDAAGDNLYRITGHKWFLSAPMCDAFLVLAYAPEGLSCFLMPRFTPAGDANAIRLLRLKDKLGNRSNASCEVEFDNALAYRVGEEGRGVRTIIEMASYTRLDCAVSSAALMRQAVAQAIHHCAHRSVFQKKLIDQPLMTRVLADMALECEAATALAFRVARAFDEAAQDKAALAYRRLMTPIAKYQVCKRGPVLACEAMESIGGNGYVEESILSRIYREMPVNAIWEGSGNVMCLDVLRVLAREPDALEVVMAEFASLRGTDARYDAALEKLERLLADRAGWEAHARQIVESFAKLAQAGLLLRDAPPEVSDAFCATRLGGDWGETFGALPAGVDAQAIVARAAPVL